MFFLKNKNNFYYVYLYFFLFIFFFSLFSYTIPLYKIICNLNTNVFIFSFLSYNNYCFFFYNNFFFEYLSFMFIYNISSFFFCFFFFDYIKNNLFFYLSSNFFFYDLIQLFFYTRNNFYNFLMFETLQYKLFLFTSELSLVFFRIINQINKIYNCFSIYVVFPQIYYSYINKLQCFCFDLIRILPLEIIDLPVLFYIKKEKFFLYENIIYNIYITYILIITNFI